MEKRVIENITSKKGRNTAPAIALTCFGLEYDKVKDYSRNEAAIISSGTLEGILGYVFAQFYIENMDSNIYK